MTPFTPTINDMQGEYYGVLVTTLGEDGETAMAITGDTRKAIAALNGFYREICGYVNLLDQPGLTVVEAKQHLKQERVRFRRLADAPDDGSWWDTVPAESDPDAVTVTLLYPYPTHTNDLIAVKAASVHAWYRFAHEHGSKARVPDWRIHSTHDGALSLSCQVVGDGAAELLHKFADESPLILNAPGDQRPTYDYSTPGRTSCVWRASGVWVELWHPDITPVLGRDKARRPAPPLRPTPVAPPPQHQKETAA